MVHHRKLVPLLCVTSSLALVGCGRQNISAPVPPQSFASVPTHLAQALAVMTAEQELGITPQTADDTWVASTLMYDPLMRPAFWANLIVQGRAPTNFWTALANAKADDAVYLTGAATNRTFHGDVFEVEVFRKLREHCLDCELVNYNNAVYGVKGGVWTDQSGRELTTQETTTATTLFAKVARSVEAGDLPTELAKRWQRLADEEAENAPTSTLRPTSVSAPFMPPILHVGSQLYKTKSGNAKNVDAQTTTRNDCTQWFWWSCTVRVIEGELKTNASYDFGNRQSIHSSVAWRMNPKQNYDNPLGAPYETNSDNVWGDWDFPSPIWRGLLVDSDYPGGQYLVGCGALAVARLLDWARASNKLPGNRDITLPRDDLTNSTTLVPFGKVDVISGRTDMQLNSLQFMQMMFWPVKVGERKIDGADRTVYASWLSERMGSTFFKDITNTTTAELINGANAWLSSNGWPERLTGAWSREVGLRLVVDVLPVLSWVQWSQATWGVNDVLQKSIGAPAGQDMPAVIGYISNFSNGHYALSKKFTIMQYWDWSENYAYVNYNGNEGDVSYKNSTKVYLSDAYDLLFAAYRFQ